MIESFDVTILLPVGYASVAEVRGYSAGNHDAATTNLLRQALAKRAKPFLESQWDVLRGIRKEALEEKRSPTLENTQSRYRIGLLHLYLLYRVIQHVSGSKAVKLEELIRKMSSVAKSETRLDKLALASVFSGVSRDHVFEVFKTLSEIYVRKGSNAKFFLTFGGLSPLSENPGATGTVRVRFNADLDYA
jgi:hypothetical protein